MDTLKLVNNDGRPFTAVYEPGGGRGRDGATVTFYDSASSHYPFPGQKTYSYYADTFLAHRGTLRLHTEIPEWTLSETNVLDVQAWLAKLDSQTS